jgi:hypothetical protein
MESNDRQNIPERILARVTEADGERRISCKDALGLADELGVAPAEIGEFCDDNEIKIRSCQLGCF